MADNGYTSRWSTNGREPDSVLFTNVRILDATGEYPYTGEVLVQGNRIKQVTRGSSRFGTAGGDRRRPRSSTAWARR